jgi:2-oxoglutarate ferredoxin oxidoreductase subunit gamma
MTMDRWRQIARRELEDRFEVRLAGEGGQGMILAGIILAEAAAIHDGLNAVQTQSYGPEARGGASRSEVVIAEGEIDYPKALNPDVVLCMSQEACDRFCYSVKEDGLTIVDSTTVIRAPEHRGIAVPISRIATEATGRPITASMAALGILVGLTGVISRRALEASVSDRVPKGTAEMNLRALAAGFAEAARLREEGTEHSID